MICPLLQVVDPLQVLTFTNEFSLRTGNANLRQTQEYPSGFAKAIATLHLDDENTEKAPSLYEDCMRTNHVYLGLLTTCEAIPGITLQGILAAKLEAGLQNG